MAKTSRKSSLTEYCSKAKKEEIIDSLSKIYGLFTPNMLSWLAGLFDSETGGFYYSNSARDTDGFLPDIGSTKQALEILEMSGAISSYDNLPILLKREITFFVCQREDKETGLFLHPQWEYQQVQMHISRLSRDLQSAETIVNELPCNLNSEPITNAAKKITNNKFFNYLSSKDALASFLEQLPFNYESASFLSSQISLFKSLGLDGIVCDWLVTKQNPNTGLFEDENNRTAVSSFRQVSSFFIATDRWLPNTEKAVSHILKHMTTPSMSTVYYVAACWHSLSNINYLCRNDKETLCKVLKEICESVTVPLEYTYNTLLNSKWDDGSFSYYPSGSCHLCWGMPVAVPDAKEGDVNATLLAIGTFIAMYRAMGLDAVRTPIFNSNDFAHFLNKIKIY